MKTLFYTLLIMLCLNGLQAQAQSKWLKKAKEKLEKKGDKAIDGFLGGKKKGSKNDGNSGSNQNTGNGNASGDTGLGNRSGKPGKRGENTPPPINQSISDAQSALSGKDYAETRYAIQQALWGVEYELGKDVLASFPTKLNDADYIASEDFIGSMGFGFEGFSIRRKYQDPNSRVETYVSVTRDAAYEEYSLILSNPRLYNNSDQDYKVVKINDFKAVIEYTSSGYEVGIPFGQSSVFQLEAYNYENEDDVINAVSQFDISKIKELLKEQ